MIIITGDTHGDISRFDDLEERFENLTENDVVIVTGDFGFLFNDKKGKPRIENLTTKSYKILFVDGNHEDYEKLKSYPIESFFGGKVHKISDNIFHLMRGEIFEIENKKIFCFGGAYSIDRWLRKKDVSYFEEEIPSKEEMENAIKNLEKYNFNVDYIITHTLPTSIIRLMKYEITEENLDKEFTDFLDEIREKTNFQKWFAGHFHKDKYAIESRDFLVLYKSFYIIE